MKRYYQITLAALLLSICFTACQDTKKNDYPTNYVGFEYPTQEHRYNTENPEEMLELTIIATEKEKIDRVVKLSGSSIAMPGKPSFFQLMEEKVTIKANQKSATTQIKIFPRQVIKNVHIRLTCSPQWKAEDAKQSQLSIRLLPK